MTIEHIAIWVNDLEKMQQFYVAFFNGVTNQLYHNAGKQFSSYFIQFEDGARLELMHRPDIAALIHAGEQKLGYAHLAFGAISKKEVDEKCKQLQAAGFTILSGPRKTGDGYYEFETLDPENNRIEVSAIWREDD
ncbi:MAG: hypothetical protein RLY16_1862 [Bacteroidota bacterium]|jgi:lactoylglutathione lyase